MFRRRCGVIPLGVIPRNGGDQVVDEGVVATVLVNVMIVV